MRCEARGATRILLGSNIEREQDEQQSENKATAVASDCVVVDIPGDTVAHVHTRAMRW